MNPSSLKFRRTGKMTLLFTVLCASALNGMEMEPEWEQIKAIKACDQRNFIRLVHILADKFNITTHGVAQKVNTDTAKNYIKNSGAMLDLNLNEIKCRSCLSNGGDVNYTKPMYNPFTGDLLIGSPLWAQVKNDDLDVVKLLLDYGAKPERDDYYCFYPNQCCSYYKDTVKELLAQARLKQECNNLK